MKCLDPKADLTFKRIFGEHENTSDSDCQTALAWLKFLTEIDRTFG